MIWGIPADLFLKIHVALSLIAIVSGLVVVYNALADTLHTGWTILFVAALILTSVTGFSIPPLGLDPPRIIGLISLVLLAIAIIAWVVFQFAGAWRWIYLVAAVTAFYLDAFVAVI